MAKCIVIGGSIMYAESDDESDVSEMETLLRRFGAKALARGIEAVHHSLKWQGVPRHVICIEKAWRFFRRLRLA